MKVLIIPEDPTNDSFIIKPVIEAVFADLGRRARIDMLRDPQLRGTSDALDGAMVTRIIDENPMEDHRRQLRAWLDRQHSEFVVAAGGRGT